MKLTALHLIPYALPFGSPFRTARGTVTERRGYLVWLCDEDGQCGMGEAAPLEDFGTETLAETRDALRAWAGILAGQTLPDAPPSLSEASPLLEWAEGSSYVPAARHGLELALLDLLARRRGRSVAHLLRADAADAVAVNATLSGDTPQVSAQQARTAQARGFGSLKLKVGVGSEVEDEARVRAVREAVGMGMRLRLDANGAWNEEQALRLLTRWQPYDLEYVEQPLPPGLLDAMTRLAARSPVPLALDESVDSLESAREALRRRAAHVLVLKPMVLGGLLSTLRIAQEAADHAVPVVVTTLLEGAYGRAGALHVAAAIRALPMAGAKRLPDCGLATGDWLLRDFPVQAPRVEQGRLTLPPAPGLGLRLPLPQRAIRAETLDDLFPESLFPPPVDARIH